MDKVILIVFNLVFLIIYGIIKANNVNTLHFGKKERDNGVNTLAHDKLSSQGIISGHFYDLWLKLLLLHHDGRRMS